jgi:hypothetical protein
MKQVESHGIMTVEILQCGGVWCLRIASTSGHVFKVFTASRLIELLDLASLMQLRVNNELPLNQYLKVG